MLNILTDLEANGVSQYANETHVHFGGSGGYTFFTSEGIDLNQTFMRGYPEGSTTLVQLKGSGTTAKLVPKPLNSSKYSSRTKKWGNVSASGAWWGNMTIDAFVNDAKDNMYISYYAGGVCLSDKGGTSYKSGIIANMPFGSYDDTNITWMHDFGWNIAPTIYSKNSANTVLKVKNVQTLYPKTKSPRWHRRSAVQIVSSEDYGGRVFLIYTDLLSTFYVYAAYIPRVTKDENGVETAILLQYNSSNDWAVPTEYYKTGTFSWGDAIPPNLNRFFGYSPIATTYSITYGTSFADWKADFPTSSNTNATYDTWMGGAEATYEDKVNLIDTQYLWTFNYNATKATTIAFKKGDALEFKNLENVRSNMYHFRGLPYLVSGSVKNDIHKNEILGNEKLDDVTLDKMCEYYPILMELDIKIEITGKGLKNFDITVTPTSKSSYLTEEYYLSSGYTHPILDSKGVITGGNELSYMWLSCHGEIDNYNSEEFPYDIVFKTKGDPIAEEDIPEIFSSVTTDVYFMKTLISGDYDPAVIRAFVDSIEGIDDFITGCYEIVDTYRTVFGDFYTRTRDYKGTDNRGWYYISQEDKIRRSYTEGKEGSIFSPKSLKNWHYESKDNTSHLLKVVIEDLRSFEALSLISGNKDLSTSMAYSFHMRSTYGFERIPTGTNFYTSDAIPGNWSIDSTENSEGKLLTYLNSQGFPSTKLYATSAQTGGAPRYLERTKEAYTAFAFTNAVIDYVSLIYFLMSENYGNSTIKNDDINYYAKSDYLIKDIAGHAYKDFTCFYALLIKHINKNQVLLDACFSITPIVRICLFSLLDKLFDKLPYVPPSDIKVIKNMYAKLLTSNFEDYTFNDVYGNDSENFLKNLYKPNYQVIDGILTPNTYYNFFGYPKGDMNTSVAVDKLVRSYRTLLPSKDLELFNGELNSPQAFGKKIKNFKSILNFTTGTNVNKYLLLTTPYASIQSLSSFIASIGSTFYVEGDKAPYASGMYLPEATSTQGNEPMYDEVVKSFGMCTNPSKWWMVSWPSGDFPGRFKTNAVQFKLFVKTNKETFANNIAAVDFGSSSIMFYGSQANYHYAEYGVGTSFYINHEIQETYGISTNNPPDEIGDVSPKLDIVRFNMLYNLSASIHTVSDIPLLPSYTLEKNKMYGADSEAYAGQEIPGNFILDSSKWTAGISVKDTYNVTSFITSHPNGSIAAYMLPPIGFLKAGVEAPKITATYDASYTIDYIKMLKKAKIITPQTATAPATTTEATFIETTHKKMFNTAFSESRDYTYYTDPSTETFAGGFATAGVFYTFNVPNQYKEATANLVTRATTTTT